jgi:hypothetical protein
MINYLPKLASAFEDLEEIDLELWDKLLNKSPKFSCLLCVLEGKIVDGFGLGDSKDDDLISLGDCVKEVFFNSMSFKKSWILVEFFWLAYSRGFNPSIFWCKRLIPRAISFIAVSKSFFSIAIWRALFPSLSTELSLPRFFKKWSVNIVSKLLLIADPIKVPTK